ncbi:inner membrane protein YpjD [Celerinatantimonas sp. MCCC 1A17872]|uniref:cytochrome C assembly family protein n=1 Tax=Celerinatantimonas sp. MCCC 1A17872 TaxID=3177514 RepID=UPI0038C6215A
MNLVLLPAIVFYLIASYACGKSLLSQEAKKRRSVLICATFALILHGVWVSQHMLLTNGQDLSIVNVAVLLCLLLSLSVTMGCSRFQLWIMLPVVYIASVITLLLAHFIRTPYILHLGIYPQVMVHIGFALVAFTVMMIAALFALQLGYLDYSLKRHRPHALKLSMPPLIKIENQLVALIQIGMVLLTISLITGFVFLSHIFDNNQVHKAILAVIAWFVYLLLLLGHRYWGWRGRTIGVLTLLGAILLILSYFGSRLLSNFY